MGIRVIAAQEVRKRQADSNVKTMILSIINASFAKIVSLFAIGDEGSISNDLFTRPCLNEGKL